MLVKKLSMTLELDGVPRYFIKKVPRYRYSVPSTDGTVPCTKIPQHCPTLITIVHIQFRYDCLARRAANKNSASRPTLSYILPNFPGLRLLLDSISYHLLSPCSRNSSHSLCYAAAVCHLLTLPHSNNTA